MAENDITTSIEASDADVSDLKKAHYDMAGAEAAKATRMAPPVQEQQRGLNQELLNMLKLGKRYASFNGIDRCIRILDANTDHAHHCGAMMVKNLSINQLMCSSCDRIKDANAKPKVINSSMIRLSQKELEECGLKEDPLLNAKSDPIKQPKREKQSQKEAVAATRKVRMKAPSEIKIEVTMKELNQGPNVLKTILERALESIYELPVSNFREAEEIRVVKEKVEAYLKLLNYPGDEK